MPEFWNTMEDNFDMYNQTLLGLSVGANSSASSTHGDLTPNSRRPSPTDLTLDIDSAMLTHWPLSELTPPFQSMPETMFGPAGLENLLFPTELHTSFVTTTTGDMAAPNDDHTPGENDISQLSMDPDATFGRDPVHMLSPNTVMEPTSPVVIPTPCHSGSEVTESILSWSGADDSPPSLLHRKDCGSSNMGPLDWDRQSQSPVKTYPRLRRPTPEKFLHNYRTFHGTHRYATELHLVQMKQARKGSNGNNSAIDVVRRAMCTCNYPGCYKAFCRNEHLKRHKQTVHGEGPNSFSCEFCGKDQFNRRDNLNTHRKLHARPNRKNCAVIFIPAAVYAIEQEERSRKRKRRAPVKSKRAEKHGDEF